MEIVLVTAGNSFVGQHFIKHLQLYGPTTMKEIRVLDETYFERKLDYNARVPVTSFLGTIFTEDILKKALFNVDTLVHLYELKDTSMLPDRKAMERVNVEGTKILVDACKLYPRVKRFLLLSSSDVMISNHVACDANVGEGWAVPEGRWAYPDYCQTKYESEKLLFACDSFQSFAARLGPVYGELDDAEWGIGAHLKIGKRFNGIVPVLGDRQGTIMHTYIGNATYGMVKILEKMVADTSATKETVFLLDDTPLIDFHSIMEPIVKAVKYRLVNIPIWFMLYFIPYCFLEKLVNWSANFIRFGLEGTFRKLPSARIIYNYFYTYNTFSNFKGLTYIGYKPLYDHESALANCIKYYTDNL